MSDRQQKWLFLIPVVIAACALLPFLDKAYTVDDTLFMLQSQQALKDPLHPTAFDVVWDKNISMRCSAIMPSGPTQAYLLVPSLLFGGIEWIAHLTQFGVLLLGLWGTIRLAKTLGFSDAEAAFAASIVACSPCVLGMASTVMPDVPAMSFGICGLDFFTRWRTRRRLVDGSLAVFMLVLAALSRPHAAAFVGVAFLAAGDYDANRPLIKSLSWHVRNIYPLVVAAGAVVAYGFLFKDPAASGGTLATSTSSLAGWTQPERHFISSLAHWAFTTPAAALMVLIVGRRLDWRLVAFTVLPLGVLIVGIQYETQAWVAIPSAIALSVLVYWLRTNPGLPVPIFLALAASLLLPLPLVIYVHLPAKYLVTSIPGAALLVVAHARMIPLARWKKRLVPVLFAAYATVSLLVIHGDYGFANVGRRAAAELIAPLVAEGNKVWFAGHWGFQWYAMKAGGVALTSDAAPSPRDYLVSASWQYDGGPLAERFSNKVLINKLSDVNNWSHVMKANLGAGFYSNWWGLQPWAYGDTPMEDFSLWQFIYSGVDP